MRYERQGESLTIERREREKVCHQRRRQRQRVREREWCVWLCVWCVCGGVCDGKREKDILIDRTEEKERDSEI